MIEKKHNGVPFIVNQWPLNPKKASLFLIHGASLSKMMWQLQMKMLPNTINILAVDLPGHGQNNMSGMDTIKALTKYTYHFINDLKVPQPVPCGFSMGGAIVQQLLIDYPTAFKGAILANTAAKLRVSRALLSAIETDYKRFVELVRNTMTLNPLEQNCISPIIDIIEHCAPEIALKAFNACNAFDVTSKISSIRCPVLIITSSNDLLTPPRYGDFLEKHINKSKQIRIKGAAHLSPFEKPFEFNQATLNFIDTIF